MKEVNVTARVMFEFRCRVNEEDDIEQQAMDGALECLGWNVKDTAEIEKVWIEEDE